MYDRFFNLSGLPFRLSPDPRFYFEGETHRKAKAYLTYGLNQGEGFVVVTGPIGAGKTMLIRQMLGELDQKRFRTGTIVTTQLDPTDTLRMLAAAFGIFDGEGSKAELVRRVEGFLTECHADGRQPLLLIDEAQNLPVSSLEELRMLTNLEVDASRSAMQIVLVGQDHFRRTLASPDLEQLRQRVVAAHHLAPLSPTECEAYVRHRLSQVDWRDDPAFDEDAFAAIHDATGGVPRRINTLCTRILLFAALDGRHRIDRATIEAIAEELRQESAALLAESGGESDESMDGEGRAVVAGLNRRLEAVELSLTSQARMIRRAVQIAARYLGDGEQPSQPTGSGTRDGGAERGTGS